MNNIVFLVMRRLRVPLVTLIVIWAVSILGYVLIPGRDASGEVVAMDFLHAFYFVSYMGTTIGFGEIPHAFTAVQRLWTLVTIYATVIGWFYSIGALVAIFRDQSLLNLIRRSRFRRRVAALKEPFHLVCGYGLTGQALVTDLAAHGLQSVVIDIDPRRSEGLDLDNHPFDIPHLCADASDPEVLQDAGIRHPRCSGVICLTNDDHANLYVALSGKLLAPRRMVISRVSTADYAANLASFGTDHIIDPFETFADYLVKTIVSPFHQLVYNWLASPRHRPLDSARKNRRGTWILCGYGRLGRALQKRMQSHGIQTVVIEPDPSAPHSVGGVPLVRGLGTEAVTLREAGVEDAIGIVAGTADDANNLSIVMTARELNPEIYAVARQNHQPNAALFEAARVDFIMDPSVIIAQAIMFLIKTPQLMTFLDALSRQSEAWCEALLERIHERVDQQAVESWSIHIDSGETPALMQAIADGEPISLQLLGRHPHDRTRRLPVLPLLVERAGDAILLPGEDWTLQAGDTVLFCGLDWVQGQMLWTVSNHNVLRYVMSGSEGASGLVWKRLTRRWRSGARGSSGNSRPGDYNEAIRRQGADP